MSLLKGRRIPVEHCAEKELWENQGRGKRSACQVLIFGPYQISKQNVKEAVGHRILQKNVRDKRSESLGNLQAVGA